MSRRGCSGLNWPQKDGEWVGSDCPGQLGSLLQVGQGSSWAERSCHCLWGEGVDSLWGSRVCSYRCLRTRGLGPDLLALLHNIKKLSITVRLSQASWRQGSVMIRKPGSYHLEHQTLHSVNKAGFAAQAYVLVPNLSASSCAHAKGTYSTGGHVHEKGM